MNTDEENAPTERVIGAILEVSNTLGAGFLEKPYQRAWAAGTRACAASGLLELKCVERLAQEHVAQYLNYLRVSCRRICLLVNFQRPKAEWQRIVQGYPTPGVVDPPLS